MTSLEYFRLFAPEFSNVSDSVVTVWLTIAESLIDIGCLGDEIKLMAIALYAAHLLSMSQSSAGGGGSIAGPITREREGDLEREFAVSKNSDGYLGQTVYGQQFLDITRGCKGMGIFTRVTV